VPALGQIFRSAGPAFVRSLGRPLLPSHLRAMRDIAACRTEAFGGHVHQCDRCGHHHFSYHSCGNRHCPACGHDRAERRIERWRDLLPPCRYYLITVTLPAQLRSVARANQRLVYSLLLHEAAHAVLRLAQDPEWVGGQPAILAVLHTWSRAMAFHPHVHLLVSAGGLSADREAWVKPANPRFLLPGFLLQHRFRAQLEKAFKTAGLHSLVPSAVWRSRWVAHVKDVGSGLHALRYLGRYRSASPSPTAPSRRSTARPSPSAGSSRVQLARVAAPSPSIASSPASSSTCSPTASSRSAPTGCSHQAPEPASTPRTASSKVIATPSAPGSSSSPPGPTRRLPT
jgi:ribosomal protein L37E